MDRNRDLFWELLEPEHQRVRAFCRKLAGDRERGDDLCQEALLAALRRFHTLRDTARFKAWLYRIVLNCHRNACKGHFWKRFVPWVEDVSGIGAGPDPGAAHAAKRMLDLLLDRLSADDRALITLFELEGWCLTDLATLTGRSEGSLKVRLFRIRQRMRVALMRNLKKGQRDRTITAVGEERLCIVTKPGAE